MTETIQPNQPIDLDAITAREQATTGPDWFLDVDGGGDTEIWYPGHTSGDPYPVPGIVPTRMAAADLQFIGHARGDIRALLVEVRRMRDLRQHVRAAISQALPHVQHAYAHDRLRGLLADIDGPALARLAADLRADAEADARGELPTRTSEDIAAALGVELPGEPQ